MLYADDIVLIDKCANKLNANLQLWRRALEDNGLRISRSKTEYLKCSFSEQPLSSTDIVIEGQPVPKLNQFKYLGFMLTADANIDADVTHKNNAGWLRWRTLTGVLCDDQMPIRLKGRIYKTAVRPSLMYGSECWATNKKYEQKMHTNEMKIETGQSSK
ncbi:uncharacterized protein LOC133516671 [Cydia pomonella]|uniref:uncharacterized protein LOC133516671 n=1 Tax=Cydia pomonella TaxID=82600 RepID=UPI002ADD8372|nr:uncharacterized protein LOC133516671 [Cydia pomonella]